jgi:hypothetical protein
MGEVPGVIDYFSRFPSLNFLCVFFSFHTDEARGHCYGFVDPLSPLDARATQDAVALLQA